MYICVVQYVLYFAQFESCSILLPTTTTITFIKSWLYTTTTVNLSINIELNIQNCINVLYSNMYLHCRNIPALAAVTARPRVTVSPCWWSCCGPTVPAASSLTPPTPSPPPGSTPAIWPHRKTST